MYHICNKLYSVRGHLVVLCLGFCKEYNSECWGACVFLNDGFLGDIGPGVDVRYEALLSCMRRLSSLGVVAMSIPTNCVVGFNDVLALSCFCCLQTFEDIHSDWWDLIS